MADPYALLVIDDAKYAADLSATLSGAGIELVYGVGHSHAVEMARISPPALLLLDLDRPARESVRLLGDLLRHGVKAPILWLTAHLNEAAVKRVRQFGAQGVLQKGADTVSTVCAVRAVLGGDSYFPSRMTNPATPGAKAEEESRRIIKLLRDYAQKG